MHSKVSRYWAQASNVNIRFKHSTKFMIEFSEVRLKNFKLSLIRDFYFSFFDLNK